MRNIDPNKLIEDQRDETLATWDSEPEPVEETYSIIRMYRDTDKRNYVVKTGLTLEQAQTHCRRDDTHGEGWFDGYEGE